MVTHCSEQDTTGAGTIQAQDKNKLCSLKSYNTNGQGTDKSRFFALNFSETPRHHCFSRKAETVAYHQFNSCCNFVDNIASNKTVGAESMLLSQVVLQVFYRCFFRAGALYGSSLIFFR